MIELPSARHERARPSRWTPWVLSVVVWLLTAWFFPYFPSLGSPNEHSRLYLTRAILDDGSFSIDGPVSRYGRISDLAGHRDRLYSDKAPGVALAGVPVYLALKTLAGWEAHSVSNASLLRWMRIFLAGLPTALIALLLYFLLGQFELSRELRLALMLAYGLGTIALPYGVLLYGHQLAALCLVGAFSLAQRQSRAPGILPILGCGLLLGCALVVEYTTVLLVVPLAVYVVVASPRRPRNFFLGVLGALPPLGFLAVYHQICFGSIFSTGYSHLVHAQFAAVHDRGLWGLVAPGLSRLGNILFSPGRGLLFYSPWLLLAVPAMAVSIAVPRSPNWRKVWMAVAAGSLFYFLFSSSLQLSAWGWSLGPRHLAPLIPFWVLAVGTLFRHRKPLPRWSLRALRVLVPFSMIAVALPTATFGGFPPDFSNPLADFSVRLLASGCVSPSLGTALGLSPGWAALPFWIVLLGLFGWLAWPRGASIQEKTISTALLAGLLALALLTTGPPDPGEERTLNWIHNDILRCAQDW